MREEQRDGETRRRWGKISSSHRLSVSSSATCPACGTAATRDYAKFCRICGKLLTEEYQPLDTIRASYRLQGKEFQLTDKSAAENLFKENENSASSTASAFLVYSLVPYLGILFCPGALLMSSVGIVVSYRQPSLGGRRTAIYNAVLSILIFAVQILLWWLLYIVPELGRKI